MTLKDKDLTPKDKDLKYVLKESLRTRINITVFYSFIIWEILREV